MNLNPSYMKERSNVVLHSLSGKGHVCLKTKSGFRWLKDVDCIHVWELRFTNAFGVTDFSDIHKKHGETNLKTSRSLRPEFQVIK